MKDNNAQPSKSRNGNQKLLKIFEKFDFYKSSALAEGTCGNLCSDLYPYFKPDTFEPTNNSFSDLVSAPMLLARLASAGCPIIVLGQDGYKCTWETLMVHKESRKVVTFYDYKGAASFGSSWPLDKVKDSKFIKDVKALTLALTNARFPHPYDGCAVGEIA